MHNPGFSILGFVACIFGVFLGYEVLYLFHRRSCIHECARLNVLDDKTYRSPSGRPLILPILLVVAGLSAARVSVSS
jgi:hypothetical protein